MKRDRLAVIGQGYVGLPLTMSAVRAGFDVVGIDLDARKVGLLKAGRSFIGDVTDSEVQESLATGRYLPTVTYDDAADFEYAIITVPTPLRDSQPDLSYIEQAVTAIAPLLTRGALVVLESTSYPGTTEDLVVPGLQVGSGLRAGVDFGVGFSPERIDPGNPRWGFRNTPKIVSGIDASALRKAADLYGRLVDTVVEVSSTREAELAKLLENTFRHINIALVNEIAILASQLNINIWESIDAAATKPFGFMKFTPGPGVGGHCLPVDPSYLSWQARRKLGRASRFIELANDVNSHMPEYVVERLILGLNNSGRALRGSKVLLMGLAYKRNSADARESPTYRVIELLRTFYPVIQVADPFVADADVPADVERVDLTAEIVNDADAVVILTGHDAFDYELLRGVRGFVLDTQRVAAVESAELL